MRTRTKSVAGKLTAFLMSAAMCTGMLAAVPSASAVKTDNTPVVKVTDKSNSEITVNDLNVGVSREGSVISVKFDANSFKDAEQTKPDFASIYFEDKTDRSGNITYKSLTSAFEMEVSSADNTAFGLTGSRDITDSTLFTVNYNVENFKSATDYSFKYTFTEVTKADSSLTLYDWADGNENATFTITYREDTKYEVTFKGVNVTETKVDVVDGEKLAANQIPANLTREGYTFSGWQLNGADFDTANTAITADIVLMAKWTKNQQSQDEQTVDLSKIKITKNVNVPDGVDYDEVTFNYTITDGKIDGAASKTVKTNTYTAPDLSTLAPSVTMSGTAKKGTYTFPADEISFPYGGVYTYTIKEVTPNPVPAFWTYDGEEYTLAIEVEEDDNGDLVVDSVKITNKAGKKVDELAFTNTYAPTTTLDVTKAVAGISKDGNENPLKSNKIFDYKIVFGSPAVNAGGKIKAIVKLDKDSAAQETEFDYGEEFEFRLKHTGSVKFENVAEGSTYTITETGADYYTASAVVKSSDGDIDAATGEKIVTETKTNGEYASDFVVTGTIAESDNSVDFTNTYSITPPTGIGVNTEVIVISGMVLLALAGMFVINRKIRSKKN